MSTTIVRRDTTASAVTAALLGVLTLVVLVRVALQSQRGQDWDDAAMHTVMGGRDTRLTVLSLLGYVGIGAIVAVVAACVVVSVLRGRIALAVGAVVVIAGSNVTTQLLKHSVLDRPDLGLGTLNSLPSGHTTVVASAVGASLLVAPRAWRSLVALGGGLATTLTGASTIVAGWHRPSDVVAALAVALVWTAGAALLLRGPASPIAGTTAGAVVGCVAAMMLLVAIGVRPVAGWDGFVEASLVLGLVTAATAVFVAAAASTAPND
ncbi:phosphatase PAP2 family protein [Aeromicrobium fastidiosum]|uniref:phosphatase PAP2 family protein n=1 Tax=Aeromicrobium fastidiosum TaxID=52699 RepID=UPI00202350C3|nr:phosphatase PAP2 family protein [Aeromicrobium fastidiosum]MCL8249915.1 phosphatase PAP2 family protein [Aeromicrobium fastidiosum]